MPSQIPDARRLTSTELAIFKKQKSPDLVLTNRGLTDQDIKKLVIVLAANPNIKKLDVSNNCLTNASAIILAKNTTLYELILQKGIWVVLATSTIKYEQLFLDRYQSGRIMILHPSGMSLNQSMHDELTHISKAAMQPATAAYLQMVNDICRDKLPHITSPVVSEKPQAEPVAIADTYHGDHRRRARSTLFQALPPAIQPQLSLQTDDIDVSPEERPITKIYGGYLSVTRSIDIRDEIHYMFDMRLFSQLDDEQRNRC